MNRTKPVAASRLRGIGFLWLLALSVFLFPQVNCQAQFLPDSLIDNDLLMLREHENLESYALDRIGSDTLYSRYVPTIDMETIEDRASCLNLDMPLVINKTVCGFIHFFAVRKRNYTQTMLERKNYYFPIFEYYLKKHQMPDALKYLSIVESGLNFKAKSRTGAVGLWQFMPGTGKDFYLAQNQLIDERRNPYLATEAACKFLKYLYGMFGDWELALAAYNCGPGNVMKAMRKSGKRGFWEIYNFLPQETRSYVPQFHAVVYTMNFAEEHNIRADIDSVLVSVPLDTFQVAKSFDLLRLETILGLPEKTLVHYNPTFSTHIYPAGSRHPLLVPASHSELLSLNLDRFIDSAFVSVSVDAAPAKRSDKYQYFLCHKGDKIKDIAKKHKVQAEELCRINHLQGEKLSKTRKLKFPKSTQQEVLVASAKSKEEIPTAGRETEKQFEKAAPGTHIVRKGEKLYSIAASYNVKPQDLKKWNHLHTSKVVTGQVLHVTGDGFVEQDNNEVSKLTRTKTEPKESIEENTASLYTVKKGDKLFLLARNAKVPMSNILEWNPGISTSLKEGQKIYLSKPIAEAICLSDSSEADKATVASAPTSTLSSKKLLKEKPKLEIARTYLVQKGDTLYSITRKFTKLTIKDLMRINKLKDKNIKPGQQLIIG
jgi:membrane-bound lytic murein transglycosylase D